MTDLQLDIAPTDQPHPRIQSLLDQPGASIPQRSPEWFARRKLYLTASNCAGALGIKPYASYKGNARLELMQKLKAADDKPFSNQYTEHGVRFEAEAISKFEELTGQRVIETSMLTNPAYPILGASPDGLCAFADDEGRVSAIEVKCPMSRAIKPGAVPELYYPQLMVQMYVLDVDRMYFIQYKPVTLTWPDPEVLDVQEVLRSQETDDWWAENYPKLEQFWSDLQSYQLPGPSKQLYIPACNVKVKKASKPVISSLVNNMYGSDDDL